MTLSELERLIADDEGSMVEYKETTSQRVEGCRTLCAFMNGRGGTVVFGVTKKGKITGQIVSDETKRTLADAFYAFEPGTDIPVEYVDVDATHKAIVCRVGSGPRRPYVYDGKPYKRIESTTVRMSQEEYETLLKARMAGNVEEDFSAMACAGLSLADLDEDAISAFRNLWALKSGSDRIRNLSTDQLLRDCGAMKRSGELTYAALILFGNTSAIRECLPSAECVFEYRTHDSSGPADDRKSYRDAFFCIYDALWNRINLRNTRQHYQDGLFVMDIPLFNERVVREALLNAVTHRDYRMQGYVLIRQFPELLRIENPGGFPSGVTQDNVLDCSTPRNRLLAEIFELAGLVERAGQGVNLMFELSVREAKSLPDYSRSDTMNVRLDLNGLLIDPALLRMIQNIEDRTLAQFCTEDFLVLHELANGYRPARALSSRIPRLMELGLIEKVERGHYVLSRTYYVQKGEPGRHTRRVGLVASECKELIVKHLRLSNGMGVPGSEFCEMLQGTPERRVKYFLCQLRDEKRIRVWGHGRSSRWYLGEAELDK